MYTACIQLGNHHGVRNLCKNMMIYWHMLKANMFNLLNMPPISCFMVYQLLLRSTLLFFFSSNISLWQSNDFPLIIQRFLNYCWLLHGANSSSELFPCKINQELFDYKIYDHWCLFVTNQENNYESLTKMLSVLLVILLLQKSIIQKCQLFYNFLIVKLWKFSHLNSVWTSVECSRMFSSSRSPFPVFFPKKQTYEYDLYDS